ncbi:MAG: ABC-2 family transporter protein [Acidimicrobiales bacterium]
MRLYVEVARHSYARISTYRSATVAGVFTNTVFGFLLAYILLAVHAERGEIGGFDAVDTVTFTFVAQGLLMVLGMFNDTEIADRISTGDVVVDLQRPYDHQGWWAGVSYGKAAYYAIFRGVPPFLAGAVVFDLRLPSPGTAVAFAVSIVLAVGVAFGWRYLLQISAFWIIDVRGANQLGWLTAQFLSGAFLPIVFFPGWLETLARALPFAYMLQVPVEVWLGRYDAAELPGVFALQVAWAAALVLAGRYVMRRAVQRVVVQGG